MILQIAWKNIWRNKLRSSVVIASITIGLIAGIFSVAVMNGALKDRIDSAISNELSSIQIHQNLYLDNGDINDYIADSELIIKDLEQLSAVEAVSGRIKIEAMINHGHGPRGVFIYGIDTEKEDAISGIPELIADSLGGWFNEKVKNPIVISTRLAEKLKVRLNANVQVDVVSVQGESMASLFKVVGIYRTDNSMFDEMTAFVPVGVIRPMVGLKEGNVHEIAVLTKEPLETDSVVEFIKKKYSIYRIDSFSILKMRNMNVSDELINDFSKLTGAKILNYSELEKILQTMRNGNLTKNEKADIRHSCEAGLNVMSWKEISPEMAITTYWVDMLMYIFVGIILLALGFGIVNTMLMVVLERVKELGMLMAIGMNRRRVYFMVILETVLLSLVGGVLGMLASSLLISWVGKVGINLSSMSEGFNALGYSTIMYPYIDLKSYIQVTIMVILTGIISALYPAWRAIRLNPAEAVRSE